MNDPRMCVNVPWPVSSTIPTPMVEPPAKAPRFSVQPVSTGFAVSSADGLWVHVPKRFPHAADVIACALNGDWDAAKAALALHRGE